MNNIIKDAINNTWKKYASEKQYKFADEALEYGWKEGCEWILIELNVRGYISDELLKRYTEALDD